MRRALLLILAVLGIASTAPRPAPAGDGVLRGVAGEAAVRFPRQTLTTLERIQRDIRGRSVGEMHLRRRIDEIERDAHRAERSADLDRSIERMRRSRVTSSDTGLLPGWSLDIRGRDRVIGTGKLFLRIGSLVDAAGTAAGDGRMDNARTLLDLARERLVRERWPEDDPNVAVLRARIAEVSARLATSPNGPRGGPRGGPTGGDQGIN
ncbi:MAG: hypothetical protein KDE35_04270 [Geminicoccaceae bacterium]|nr:hypothetical protein [Geminicoccaceae bacterium]